MIQAIIFDCFGVLISDALDVLCSQLQADNPGAITQIWSLIGQSNRGLMTSDESSTQIAEIFGMTLAEYRAKIAEGEVKDQALLDYILSLRKQYKTAMLSNIPAGSIYRRFSDEELQRYFDEVVVSGEMGYAKPEVEAYEITADRLGVGPQSCVFVDDRERYIDGAKEAGMQTILYRNYAQFRADLELLLANT